MTRNHTLDGEAVARRVAEAAWLRRRREGAGREVCLTRRYEIDTIGWVPAGRQLAGLVWAPKASAHVSSHQARPKRLLRLRQREEAEELL